MIQCVDVEPKQCNSMLGLIPLVTMHVSFGAPKTTGSD